jgi:cytoskeleton protein RodZ
MTKVTQMSMDENGVRRRIHPHEISGDSENPLETVGQDLRAARLRRGDDLATVSRVLKIRKDHLEAVEEDNFAELPGKTYAIGFVRSYSGYLGLDAVKMVERYKQEISGRHVEPLAGNANFDAEEARRLPYGWRIVAAIIGLALIYGVWHLVSGGPSPQTVPPAPALSPHPQVAAVKPPAPPPAPPAAIATGDSAAPPPAASGSGTRAALPPAPAKPQSGSLTSGVAAAQPTRDVAQASPAVPAVPPSAIPSAPATGAGSGRVYGSLNTNRRVILHIQGSTRLTVRGPDGAVYLNQNLKAGDSYWVPNIAGLSLATSDAGAVDAMVDGVELGRVGQDREILGRVSLDPASLVGRFNSH